MALFSSVTIIYFRVAFLFTLAFFCVKDVNLILQHPFVQLITQAMDLPALTLSEYSAQLGLFSFIFGLLAVHDLLPLLENNKKYFESIVPFRLLVVFSSTFYSFIRTSNLYMHNNAVFVYCFCECWINVLIYISLRDELSDQRYMLAAENMDGNSLDANMDSAYGSEDDE